MFICDKCNASTQLREGMQKLVTSTRPATYLYTVLKKKNKDKKRYLEGHLTDAEIEEYKAFNWEVVREFKTHGNEIASELSLCGACYEKETK